MIEAFFPADAGAYLKLELEMRQRRNPSYSIRAFARDLHLSPSHLSEFLSGKAMLSTRKVQDLSKILKLSKDQREHWEDLVAMKSHKIPLRKKAKVRVQRRLRESKAHIPLEIYKTISDWEHFAILAFLGTDATMSVAKLASQLNLPEARVKAALQRMERLEMLEKTEEGCKPTSTASFSGDSIPSEAIRESHRQVLHKSIEALEEFGMDERMSQSLFFSVPTKKLPELRETLRRRVLETLSEFSEAEAQPGDSVQAMTWHLFPVKGKKT